MYRSSHSQLTIHAPALGRERLHLLNHPTIATDVDGESAVFYAGKMLER